MSYPDDIVTTARKKQALHQKARLQEVERSQEHAYLLDPRIKEIDKELRGTMAKIIGCTLKPNPNIRLEDVQAENLKLQTERAQRLAALQVDATLLDGLYVCHCCNDTGWIGKSMCQCLATLCGEEQLLQLSPLLHRNPRGFDDFKLDFYDKTPKEVGGASAYDTMTMLLSYALAYVDKYPQSKIKDLIFVGGYGQGKTFLSGCIARGISQKGGSVTYSSAIALMDNFEARQYRKKESEEYEEAARKCNGFLQSDLLILDDLGMETSSPLHDSVLYDLVNSRLLANRHTIISTNFTLKELSQRYTPQVMSRLHGEYEEFPFPDGDLRKEKKEMR